MHCSVIGAGVAGIAATQALRRIGASVTLLERAPCTRSSGYQLNILPNGRYALDRIGLLDALDASGDGWPLDTGVTIDGRTGRRLQELRTHPQRGRYRGASYYRGDVHTALLSGLQGEGPIYGQSVSSVTDPDCGPVRVDCSDAGERTADLVVVADGAHSRLRGALFGKGHEVVPWLHFLLASAQIDLDGSSEAEALFREQARRHEFPQILYPGTCVVLSYAGRGRLGLIVGLLGRELPARPSGEEMKQLARRATAGLRDARVHHAIDTACWNTNDVERRPLLLRGGDIDPLPSFASGRVALLGDSAHAMLPVLGQGANQSFEDAMVLAACLRRAANARPAALPAAVREGLARYSAERVPHVTTIQSAARRIARMLASTNRLRHAANCLAARFTPQSTFARQQDYVLRYAIADPECPIERLGRRLLWRARPPRGGPARARRPSTAPAPSGPRGELTRTNVPWGSNGLG